MREKRTFEISQRSGPMTVQHIFVLMLENRSFDHMFAFSNIPGIKVATAADTNSFGGQTYTFQPGAPDLMPSDPSHGFAAVVQQLCGEGSDPNKVSPYPARTKSGFVADYSKTKIKKKPLPKAAYGKIMMGIDTATQAPALFALASEYALCDNWFASLPGPTWPNRFFVHGASSDGMCKSPSLGDIAKWEVFKGFTYPNGSIYDRLGKGSYRLYQDKSGPIAGRIPQVAAIKGIDYGDVAGLDSFEKDLKKGKAARYTFIEPAYGDIVSGSYGRGSSQHPMDGLRSGDNLIARVYNAIRKSPVWEKSLLIVTYDEHGGFFDSAVPSAKAAPPNDGTGAGQNTHGFDFAEFGVRVPAVIVSPQIAKGTVDHTLFDHASVLATVEQAFALAPLTDRDKAAKSVLPLLTQAAPFDANRLPELPIAPPPPAPMAAASVPAPADPSEPIEQAADLPGFLYVARKSQRKRQGDLQAMTAFQPVRTRADAQAYLDAVMPQLEAARTKKAGGA